MLTWIRSWLKKNISEAWLLKIRSCGCWKIRVWRHSG
jgi:hypothetical protein